MGFVRFLLALSVLITHSTAIFGIQLLNGDMAVTGFFAVSGFLMALILEKKYLGKIKAFYVNRVLRIYPAYLVSLLFAFMFFYFFQSSHHDPITQFVRLFEHGQYTSIAIATFTNITLFGIDLSRYTNYTFDKGLLFPALFHPNTTGGHNLLFVPQGWTLALELQFYIIAPLLSRWRSYWLLFVTIGCFYLEYRLTEYLGTRGYRMDMAAIFILQLRYFLLGVLAFKAYRYMTNRPLLEKILIRTSPYIFGLAIALIFFGYQMVQHFQVSADYFYLPFIACLPAVFVFGNRFRIDPKIGEYSFPIYLFHYPIAKCADLWVSPKYEGILTFISTMVLSAIFIKLIDERIQNKRKVIATTNATTV